jgi:hypothetical protein
MKTIIYLNEDNNRRLTYEKDRHDPIWGEFLSPIDGRWVVMSDYDGMLVDLMSEYIMKTLENESQ